MTDIRTPGSGPALQGRPLVDTRSDMNSYYLPRAIEHEMQDSLSRGLNVLLVGARGAGKTSLLSRLLWENAHPANTGKSGRDFVLVRGRLAGTPTAFLQLVTAALVDGWPNRSRDPGQPDLPEWGELAATDSLLRLLTQRIAERPRPVVFLVDELDPDLGNQIFGVLRDDIWGVGAQWVVTTTPEQAPTLTSAPADAFFDARVTIPVLTNTEAADLLGRRLGREVAVPDGEWTPRSLLMLAAHADPDQWESTAASHARRQTEIAKLGRPASMLAATMEHLGPVSPSDARLLDSLGWTAARASQVLGVLREAGFVTYSETPSGRQGRPARLYKLVSPDDGGDLR